MYLAHSPILWHIGFLLSNNRTIYNGSLWCLIGLKLTMSFLSLIFLVTFIFVTNIDAAD